VEAGIQAIADWYINQSIFAGQWHGWFGAVFG
jgi:hypothetical protein